MSDKIKTLSQAIRYGALLHPQSIGAIRDEQGATCAIGAALEAVGGPMELSTKLAVEFLAKRFPIINDRITSHVYPGGCLSHGIGCSLARHIVHLNDHHGWSREEIASWVQIVEQQEKEQANG